NWGSTLYGEVRGAGDFRKVMNGMLGGLWAPAGLAVVFVFLAAKTFGWEFFNASNGTYVNYAYGYVTDAPGGPTVRCPARPPRSRSRSPPGGSAGPDRCSCPRPG